MSMVLTMFEDPHPTDVNGNELDDDQLKQLRRNYGQLHLEPFRKSNWKTAESRDKWSPKLNSFTRIFDKLEYWSMLSDQTDREIKIIHYDHQNRDDWLERIGREGLHYRDIKTVRSYDGYSNRHFSTSKSDSERISYAAIAKTADAVDKAEEAELDLEGEERHRAVGNLLGFPDCCVDFFVDTWVGEHKMDNIFTIARNSGNATVVDDTGNIIRIEDPEPYTNNLWKGFNYRFTTHNPCSYDCQATIDLAKRRGRFAADSGYQDEINSLYNWLDKPMKWSGYKGLARLANADILGSYQCTPYWDTKTVIWKREHPTESVRGDIDHHGG